MENVAIRTLVSQYVHLMDQLNWVLIDGDEAIGAGTMVLSGLSQAFQVAPGHAIERQEDQVNAMIAALSTLLADGVMRRDHEPETDHSIPPCRRPEEIRE